MANQIESETGKPQKDPSRPSPDVGLQNDGQAQGTSRGASTQQASTASPAIGGSPQAGGAERAEDDLSRGTDRATADGGEVNFDDDDMAHPRGDASGMGRTTHERPDDAGRIGRSPGAGLSSRNGPSDQGGSPSDT